MREEIVLVSSKELRIVSACFLFIGVLGMLFGEPLHCETMTILGAVTVGMFFWDFVITMNAKTVQQWYPDKFPEKVDENSQ